MTDQIDQIDVDDAEETPAAASRRNFMTKGAIAVAVGAAAGVAVNQPASAANGDDLNLGQGNSATNTTSISGGSTFYVRSGNTLGDASIYGFGDTGTRATKYGVRGDFAADTTSSPDSAGVYGTTGAPEAAGVYGHHQGTNVGPGVKGVAEEGNGVEGYSDDGYGVYGETTSSNFESVAVYGDAKGSGGTGVYGTATGTDARGVYGVVGGTNSTGVVGEFKAGSSGASGSGVSGTSDDGDGVVGNGTRFDVYAAGTGLVNLRVQSSAITPTSTGAAGSIAHSSDGSLWFCYSSNQWRKLAGSDTAGAFHPVTAFRVYDSRRETDGRFDANENRTISVADARSVTDYSVTTANAVPAGATAVAGNLLAIAPSGNGFIAINPGGTTAITSSAINFTAGQNIANGSVFSLNTNRQIEAVFGPGGGAHMAFDVTGYYL